MSASHCQMFVQELLARQLPAHGALAAAGLTLDALAHEGYLRAPRFLAFLRVVEELTNDPDIGLHAGQRVELATLDLFGLLIRSSDDGRSALEAYGRYGALWRQAPKAEVSVHANQVCVRPAPARVSIPRPLVDALLSRTQRVGALLVQDGAILQVHFAYARPSDISVHRRLFRDAELCFDAEASEVVFSTSLFGVPLAHRDPALRQVLEAHVARAARSIPPPPADTVDFVRSVLLTQLRAGCVSLRSVAHALDCSERQVRRQLQQLGTSYQTLLDDIRRESALAHQATHPGEPATDLSERLGFSEPAAFYRAFKRWTGRSWSTPDPRTRAQLDVSK